MCGAPYRTLGNTAWVLYGVLSMSDARLEQFKKMAADFPDSPMSHFSLGKLYLERKQYAEAAAALEAAVRLDPTYAAALVSLGDALSGAGQVERAREVLTQAREHALAQGHPGLAEEIDERISDL
ncbi:tetratricopeptide repeat protein [Myxococcus llanfairpwllgwyngyllgogerychwyrndrobwllllantysiliogogogochensis]|uniref:Tetratricopeptide repeat protein n=2 Tax=Myxococcus llanfairpwllgwyngyllgogerychwyrndrobwllllantysiliogogogochensis TaxID=2590453 RepID=A0A540X4F6_9BACT|nr:tetratricopeptide repeat protein [Myxococcus llanfairpwllgwyngyllgogerychwyrndrobwllllantysiliogogogochensis]